MDGDEFEIVGEAASGTEALSILEKTPCDIVLTDIRMPDMDGLELLKQIQQKWPDTKTFILSNHNDFAYVQTALRLGAVEYIVKLEIEPAELMRKLREVKRQLIEERARKSRVTQLAFKVSQYGREVKEQRLRELLMKPTNRHECEEWLREFHVSPFRDGLVVTVIRIENYERLRMNNRFRNEKLLQFAVANVVMEIMKKYGRNEFASLEDGRFAIVGDTYDQTMLEEIGQAAGTFVKVALGCGVSSTVDGCSELHDAYTQALAALEQHFYGDGSGGIVRFEQMSASAPDSDERLNWDEEPWEKLIEEQDETGLRERIERWIEASYAEPRLRPAVLREQWIRLADCFARSLRKEGADIYSVTLHEGNYPYHLIRQAESLRRIHDWFVGWITVFFEYKRKNGRERWRSEVRKVVRLIQERLDSPLKVSDLASEIGFTENYLSILFKKETGETLTDFITRMRMKKARELLGNPEMKIYEVSEQVGYADPNHFSRSFKQMEGMYPTEYRKLLLGKKE